MAKKEKETVQTVEHLQSEYEGLARKLFDVRCEFRLARKLDKPHLLKKYKRDIAKVLTAISMKKKESK